MFKADIQKLVFSANFIALYKITDNREGIVGLFRVNLLNI